jgi:hypothetical protein
VNPKRSCVKPERVSAIGTRAGEIGADQSGLRASGRVLSFIEGAKEQTGTILRLVSVEKSLNTGSAESSWWMLVANWR